MLLVTFALRTSGWVGGFFFLELWSGREGSLLNIVSLVLHYLGLMRMSIFFVATVKSRLFRHAVIVFFTIFEIATPTGIAKGRYYARLRLSGTLVSAACCYRGNIDSYRVDPSA